MRTKRFFVNGIECEGTWEKKYVEWCIKKGIKIKRYNKKPLRYKYNNYNLTYTPDFIIRENGKNKMIEIKGMIMKKDEFIINEFRGQVEFLTEPRLKAMGVL